MKEISFYTSEILDEEKRKIGNEINRLCLLQNKTIKLEAIAEITRELIRRGYHSNQVQQAINSLADQDMPRISLGAILDEINETPQEGFAHLCLRCGDQDHNGDYIASGYLPALEIANDGLSCNEVRIACNCSKGKNIASEFGVTLWNGKDRMESKKKNLISKFLTSIQPTIPEISWR
jgi:hypothetical protein